MTKITKRVVDSLEIREKDYVLWDDKIQGFGVRVWPSGKKVYTLKYRNKYGRQRKPNIGIHGVVTAEKARDIALSWLNEVRDGGDPSQRIKDGRDEMIMKELYSLYMQNYSRENKKERSIKEDERLWKRHVLPYIGTLPVRSIEPSDIEKIKTTLSDKKVTFNRTRSVLHKAFELCEDVWGIRPPHSNPCKPVKKYKEREKERFLNDKELARLNHVLTHEEHNRTELSSVVTAIRLLILTGARLSEILTLKWSYVDIENGLLNLPDSKTGKKQIYLSPAAQEVLANIQKEPGNPFVIYGRVPGKHLVNIQKPWRRVRQKAELPDVRLHDLRHSFASKAAASGYSLQMIGKLLGHKQTKTTERYAHLVGDPVQSAANDIGNKISASMQNKAAEIVKLERKETYNA